MHPRNIRMPKQEAHSQVMIQVVKCQARNAIHAPCHASMVVWKSRSADSKDDFAQLPEFSQDTEYTTNRGSALHTMGT
eukprot:4639122-Pleurochrysis_carterae.AAC.1